MLVIGDDLSMTLYDCGWHNFIFTCVYEMFYDCVWPLCVLPFAVNLYGCVCLFYVFLYDCGCPVYCCWPFFSENVI